MKPERALKLVYSVLHQECKDSPNEGVQEALRVLEDYSKPEEARRTKGIEGNKYDEKSLLGDLRKKYSSSEIWSEKEAYEALGRQIGIYHLVKKMVAQGWIKKGTPADFVNFTEQRAVQGQQSSGCRIFYQLIPHIHEISDASGALLR
jgi:hypothetical protein